MQDYTNNELLRSISRRSSITFNEHTLPAGEALAIANEELQSVIGPMLMGIKAKYFHTFSDYATTQQQTAYPIPARAMGRALQNVAFVDSSGRAAKITNVDPDDEMDQAGWEAWAGNLLGGGQGYYVSGDDVILYPTSPAGQTLRLFYYALPNRLIEVSAAAKVTAVDSGTGVVTVSGKPLSWTTGERLCCVAGGPGFPLRFEMRAATAIGGASVTFASVAGIVVGDYLAPEGDSPIAQIPVEARPLLAQAAAVKVLESLRDPGITNAQAKYKEIHDGFLGTYSPRVEQAPKKISSGRGLRRFM